MNAKLQEVREILARTFEEIRCVLFHEHEPEELSSIPLTALRRQWLYDFHIADPEAFATQLGLPPYSEEGAAHERVESDRRLARIEPLLPLLVEQGEWMANVMVLAGMQAHDIDEAHRSMAMDNYRHLFVHNLMSVAATLADLGVLHVDG